MIHRISLPLQLLCIIGIVIIFGSYIPFLMLQFFYTISLIFKECLSFILPFMVFSFICSGILSFKKSAHIVMAILLLCIIFSNSITAFFSYFVSSSLLCTLTQGTTIQQFTDFSSITPLWTITLPKILSSEKAMLGAIVVGFFLSYFTLPTADEIIFKLKKIVALIMNRLFIPILPLYIFGFLLDIHQKGIFLQLFQSYGKTFALIFVLHMIMIFTLFFIASGLHVQKALDYIKNAIPSYLTAFGTMSSTATIPVTIKCAQKNIPSNDPLIQIATPITANVHLLGDAISTPLLAIVTLYLFTNVVPSISTFALFILYFCLSMLAVSGVPGGGILVMIPLLKSILGFSDPMISIITTLYVLQDAIGTAANVMGDGALMIIVDKILKKLKVN
ncbi:cation:dicarboxylase symporter family transporter [Candidatus Dependentiae bacterium]|nr:cation:dicarboxylase symporter family transporter [Candidatus Dependentiae bacterium]